MGFVDNVKIPAKCPKCESESIAYILYGLPDFQSIEDDIDSGKVRLGGCTLTEDSPQWRCIDCSHEWGELLEIDELREIRKASEIREATKKREALERGVMDAFVNEHASVRCPNCNLSFQVKYGLTEDGAHKSCGTFLNIKPKQ
jgi:DNA-directed RNA polymerase subunit RPC12/RpoP